MPQRLAAALSGSTIPALSAFRAFAVLLVVAYHGDFGVPHIPGAYGVTAFFVLSGFLITWLLLREYDGNGTVALRAFYMRRTLRIAPAFLAYWVLVVAYLLWRGRDVPWPHAFSALAYVSNYYNAINGDPNTAFSHTWSLSTEEQFYLLWPGALLLLLRARARALPTVLALVVALWAYRAALAFVFDVGQAYLYAAFDARCDALLVGCALALMLKDNRYPGAWTRLTARPSYLAITAALATLASVGDMWAGVWWYQAVVGNAVVPVLIAVAIVQAIAASQAPMWRWLESPVLLYLGRLSYSMYLWQQVTVHAATVRLGAYPAWARAGAALALTVAFAHLSYNLIERPFLRWKSALGARSSGGVAPLSAARDAAGRHVEPVTSAQGPAPTGVGRLEPAREAARVPGGTHNHACTSPDLRTAVGSGPV